MNPLMVAAMSSPAITPDPVITAGLLYAGDAAAADNFGSSIAISRDGTTVAIGARSDDNGAGSDAGAVYIQVYAAGSWSQQAKLIPGVASTLAGYSIAISEDGNTLVVGSNGQGAWVYTRTAGVWSAATALTPSVAGGNYGVSVAISGDGTKIVVGANAQTFSGNASAGAVFFWTLIASVWTEVARLNRAVGVAASQGYGLGVAMSSNGLYALTTPNGAVEPIVFFYSGGVWAQQTLLDVNGGGQSGCALSSDGLLAFVSDPAWDAPATNTGRLRVYSRNGTNWANIHTITGPGVANAIIGFFGVSCSLDGTYVCFCSADAAVTNLTFYLYRRNGATWGLIKTYVSMPNTGLAGANFVAIGADATLAALGGTNNNDFGSGAGAVRLFQNSSF